MLLRTRWAPTPSGWLHTGNALNALITFALAAKLGGKTFLRIDDLDRLRTRAVYLDDIRDTLKWLGLAPVQVPDQNALFSPFQHSRVERHRLLLQRLVDTGMVYACTCGRRHLLQRTVRAHSARYYPGTCREKGVSLQQSGVSWRLNMDFAIRACSKLLPAEHHHPERWMDGWLGPVHHPFDQYPNDPIVRRSDGEVGYPIASLSDDLDWQINAIIRGQDLVEATAVQRVIAAGLGEQQFLEIAFLHHPLRTDTAGRKLSKSEGSAALSNWRKSGHDPAPLFRESARWFSVPAEQVSRIVRLDDLVARMETRRLPYPEAFGLFC